jgi:choline dehydrogenase-like flavoprotein
LTLKSAIVIGSGPGGSVTAYELQQSGYQVTLIEEGKYWGNHIEEFSTDEMRYRYRNGGLTATSGKVPINYVEAKCVGGGSEINSGLYHRVDHELLSNWGKDWKINDLSMAKLEPYYAEVEELICVTSKEHSMEPPASEVLMRGAKKLGLRLQNVPRWYKEDNGTLVKCSMSRTYLYNYMCAGGELLSGLCARRIKYENGRWIVLCATEYQSSRIELVADVLFVCAGAIQTPFLLLKSGIKRNIGKNLKLHPTLKVLAEFDHNVQSKQYPVANRQITHFVPKYLLGSAVSNKHYLSLSMLDEEDFYSKMKDYERYSIYYSMISPKGVGKIIKVPFFKEPLVTFDLKKRDEKLLRKSVGDLVNVLFEGGSKKIKLLNRQPVEIERDWFYHQNRADWLAQIEVDSLMTIHLSSSCPMGEDKEKAAVDSYGAVHGQSNLFINDASILPDSPCLNPQGTLMAIALRNIRKFIETDYA